MPSNLPYSYYRSSRTSNVQLPAKKPNRHVMYWVVLGAVLFSFIFIRMFVARYNTVHAREVAIAEQRLLAIKLERIKKLQTAIPTILTQNSQEDFGISIIDSTNGSVNNFGDTHPFEAGSTAKILTAAAYLYLVEMHRADLHGVLGTADAQTLIKEMIVNSDDAAWATLNDYISHDTLLSYAHSLGIHDYNPTDNYLSANDIAGLLYKLDTNKLLNKTDTLILLSYMKIANYRDYIVPAVPAKDVVYHKAGLVDDNVHDSAIISNGKQSVILVIFSDGNGVYDWSARAKTMQQITTQVVQAYL